MEAHVTRISEILTAQLVVPTLPARDKDEVMDVLAAQIALHCPEVDHGQLVSALRERERQVSTALTDGVAIPHARLPGLARVVAALGRSHGGIDCGSHDGRPTHLFFLLVAPAENPGAHLKMLAAVSRLLHDDQCRTRLMQAGDHIALLDALRDEEEKTHRTVRAA
jgi:nitrogen PTS system EIIA component